MFRVAVERGRGGAAATITVTNKSDMMMVSEKTDQKIITSSLRQYYLLQAFSSEQIII